jgi:type II secretory pathway pseudopilin PulG
LVNYTHGNSINIKKSKMGISLIVLVITIIVIIILAAAVILTLTNNNPITNAKQASFVNDLDSFKSELDMYKASEYAKRIGDFEQTSLQGTEATLTFEGQTPEEAPNQTMYTAIPSLKGITKYQGQFAIKDGQLVYMGADIDKISWAEDVGVKHEVAGQPQIVLDTVGEFVVEKGIDIVYKLKINSSETITMASDILSKIKVLDNAEQNLATQPEIVVEELTGNTATLKQYSIIIKTNFLDYELYKLKIESGIATNQSGVANIPFVTANSFEVADNTPPEAPTITPSPSLFTNGNVTVTIDYKDADIKQYSYTGTEGSWVTYTAPLVISENSTIIYAKGFDTSENESGLSSTIIANIDRTMPTVAFGTNGGTNATQVSTTITASDNIGINESTLQYVWDTQNVTTPTSGWDTFANGENVSKTGDGTYYLWVKASDSAGNNVVVKSNMFEIKTISGTTYSGATTGFNYDNPIIPTGFTALNTTEANWDNLGSDWDKGLVIQDSNGNQFVWVPIDGTNVTYTKNFTYPSYYGATDSNTTDDTLPTGVTSETTQILTYKGFYIARFEAGTESSAVVSKKDATVLNIITYSNSKSTAQTMYTGTKVKSGLVTGTMWDTTMKWIQNSDKSVTDSRAWGNYSDSISPANLGNGTLPTTGYNNNWQAKNIYDLAGNVWEWTNEIYSSYRVIRGGYYYVSGSTYPASYRYGDILSNSYANVGFRVALYII